MELYFSVKSARMLFKLAKIEMNTGSLNSIVKLVKNVFRDFMKDKVNIACLMMKSTQHMSGKKLTINAQNVFM